MAKVIDNHLGAVRGKLSDVVFKMRGGKSYVARAPKKYKKTTKEGAIHNNMRFSMITKFSSAVNSSPFLKKLWKESDFLGDSAYSKIYLENYMHSGHNFMKPEACITPGKNFIEVLNTHIDESNFEIDFGITKEMFSVLSPPYIVIAIIHLSNPVVISKNHNKLIHRFIIIDKKEGNYNFSLDRINKFKFPSMKKEFNIINDFKKIAVYFAIISYPENKNPISFYANGIIVKGQEIYDNEIKESNRIKNELAEKKLSLQQSDYNIKIK